ncbi:M20 Peptidase Aminoacylase 1 subfamily protein [Aspergillus parasiticus SU-1]|uniref:M20 Peptidase Aminoacylase 1 subfamily protein n=1 Tax=Aspergillus parasiticus (strain ATCC 56775 / NRRL 5862 / SRRC 143 / SU-1) TaxID=1403190 RepID=A0A0F0IDP6_ASPPU|nr:M20 Peptidase Aminoacylase 1 subfamily protein [Aspergillus parasiticus SU-1]
MRISTRTSISIRSCHVRRNGPHRSSQNAWKWVASRSSVELAGTGGWLLRNGKGLAYPTPAKSNKSMRSGTLIVLFQPNEERLLSAKAMIDDGLFQKITLPSVCLAQHCVPTKGGTIAVKPGRVLGYLDSLKFRLSEGARRHSCGTFHTGTDASIIPDYADFQLDVRTFSENTQKLAKAAVERIIRKECEVAGFPTTPRMVTVVSSPAIYNDAVATSQFTRVFEWYYGRRASEVVQEMPPDIVADDLVLLALPPGGMPIPYVYWNIGVTDPETWERVSREGELRDLPPTHSAIYAPAIEPTLRIVIEALALAALTFLQLL